MKRLLVFVFALVTSITYIPTAKAADTAAILSTQSYTANIAGVGNIWKSNIPSSISFPSDKSYVELEFPIQGLLPYKTLSDRATGVEVDFDLWTTSGIKISSKSVYSSTWNPVGPDTLLSMTLFKNDLFGDLVFVVSTQYQISTTGLLTRYLSTETRIPLKVQGISIPQSKVTGVLVESQDDYVGNISSVGNIWKGSIPSRVSYPLSSSSQYLYFSIQGLLPYSTLADKATGVEVEFELWNSRGKKIADDKVYSFDWNPVGPNTIVGLRLSESEAIGNHTLIMRTIYEVSTTGLLTRYLQQEDKRQLTIISRKKDQTLTFKQISDVSLDRGSFSIYSSDLSSSEYSLTPQLRSETPSVCEARDRQVTLLSPGTCTLTASQPGNESISPATNVSVSFRVTEGKPKQPTSVTGTRQGTSVIYKVEGNYSTSTRFDVSISPILSPSASPTSLMNFYGPALWRTFSTNSFTITKEDIDSYLNGIVLPYSKYDSIVLIRVRAANDLGVSEWSNGIYTYVRDFGISAPIVTNPKKSTITCVKGKTVKKVTGVNPSCPSGYTRK